MNDAGAVLAGAARAALRGVAGLHSVQEAGPVRAAAPFATIEPGPESDWGHKTGAGREVRLTVLVRDRGETSERLRALAAAGEAAMLTIANPLPGWRLVSLVLLRSRIAREADGWLAAADWRARMLAEP